MRSLQIGERKITEDKCYIVAEIGSNHMGDPDICEHMIIEAAKCGVDAVKMQKRDNKHMFTKTALAREYDNDFSMGKTYGEHREKLDWFGMKEFKRFKTVAEKHGVEFFATPFEDKSVDFLCRLGVRLWKIASCDTGNFPLIEKIAAFCQPMIISTGGASIKKIEQIYDLVSQYHDNFAFLHCVSTYPNIDCQLNLEVIETLRVMFPDILIGFSSHHSGILPLVIARTLGASIIEVHFTMNRSWRGTDHGFSFEPKGLTQLVEDIHRVSVMIGNGDKEVLSEEISGFVKKMGKGIYLKRPMKAGERIGKHDLCIKSPADGLSPEKIDDITGSILVNDISTGVALKEGMLI